MTRDGYIQQANHEIEQGNYLYAYHDLRLCINCVQMTSDDLIEHIDFMAEVIRQIEDDDARQDALLYLHELDYTLGRDALEGID